jgi:hypothetical protein
VGEGIDFSISMNDVARDEAFAKHPSILDHHSPDDFPRR